MIIRNESHCYQLILFINNTNSLFTITSHLVTPVCTYRIILYYFHNILKTWSYFFPLCMKNHFTLHLKWENDITTISSFSYFFPCGHLLSFTKLFLFIHWIKFHTSHRLLLIISNITIFHGHYNCSSILMCQVNAQIWRCVFRFNNNGQFGSLQILTSVVLQ